MTTTDQAPCVYVIVVNWNGRRHLEVCLPSLLATAYPQMDVVVLDNASKDGSQKWVRENFTGVELVALEENLGFVGANNWGMRMALDAGADYVALLNNDTRVEPEWLEALVETATADPAVAICQARQRTWDGRREIRFRFKPEWAEAEAVETPVQDAGAPAPTAFASGCAMLVQCKALRRIGSFDERYFMYVEDVDLSLRAWIAGYRVMDAPGAIVYHRMRGSESRETQRMFWGYRNQLTTMLKLYQPVTLRAFARPMGRRWLRNRHAWRATLDSIRMLPGTLARRRAIQKGRRAPDDRFLRLADGAP